MSSSLKSFIPGMARLLGTTPAALYERQRALMRAGVLHADSGRGPGSGVRSTSASVTLLLVAVLGSDNLSHAAEHTKKIDEAKIVEDRGREMRHSEFGLTLHNILAFERDRKYVEGITIARNCARAEIRYLIDGFEFTHVFSGDEGEPPIRIDATISRTTLEALASDLRAVLGQELREHSGEI
ncbi:hypothetical protein [Methylobacterium oryzisoli]|uniref:hypothetical protein n=1 Tax=Methylobacterium oryzisoli TaxID=3385502 RepID=UPI003891B45A